MRLATHGRGVPSFFYSGGLLEGLAFIAAQYFQFVHQDLAESSFEFFPLGIRSASLGQLKHTIVDRAAGQVARVCTWAGSRSPRAESYRIRQSVGMGKKPALH